MDMIAPPLGKAGFAAGCTQPGPAKPQTESVTIGDITLTLTADDVLISTSDPFILKRLLAAKEKVGNRTARISRSS